MGQGDPAGLKCSSVFQGGPDDGPISADQLFLIVVENATGSKVEGHQADITIPAAELLNPFG
jgi:hypothetical protein